MFDPVKIVKEVAELQSAMLSHEARIRELESRVAEIEGGVRTAGVGHTQMLAEEVGTFSDPATSAQNDVQIARSETAAESEGGIAQQEIGGV